MRKIYLTEKQFRELVKQSINESFVSEISSRQIKNTQAEIANRIDNLIANGDENLMATINRLGFNVSFNKNDRKDFLQGLYGTNQTEKDEVKKISKEVSEKILNYANELKQYINSTGGFRETLLKLPVEKRNELLCARDLLDKIGLNALYDPSIKKRDNDLQYGLYYDENGNIQTDKFDINLYSDKKLENFGGDVEKLYASLLNRYVDSMYGVKLKMPQEMFQNGNHKLPNDTLILNFTSAERCPAWNTCIVKNACYARSVEKFRSSAMYANAMKNVMWEAGHSDPELLRLLFRLLREYAVNYRTLSFALKKKKIFNKETGKPWTPEELSALRFSDKKFPKEAISEIKNNSAIKRINNIRLNENGDFIGQWLVDAVDIEAGDFKRIGVGVTAYTCRNLSYEGISNIIINASNTAVNGETVVRRFLALEEDIYDAYDETYGGINNSLRIDRNGKVKLNPQPLFKNGNPTGEYYYKCPCGRLDEIKDKKADCYMCQTCYLPQKYNNKPYYVFVRVHGTAKEEFEGNRKSMDFGVSLNYDTRLSAIKAKKRK